MVTHGETTKVSVLETLASLANQKLPGYYFKFLPEIWEVNSEQEMLKLGCADRGDTIGGIAIRKDLHQAFQFQGGDHRVITSWGATSVPITVIAAAAANPPSPVKDDWLFVTSGFRNGFPFVGTMYHRRGNLTDTYGPFGQWKKELDRIRTTLGRQFISNIFTNIGSFALGDDGEIYGPIEVAPIQSAAFTQNRFVLNGSTQTWPQQLIGRQFPLQDNTTPYWVIPFDSLSIICLQDPAPTVEALGRLKLYTGADPAKLDFKVRITSPFPAILSTLAENGFGGRFPDGWFLVPVNLPTGTPYQVSNVTITAGAQYAKIERETFFFGGGKIDRWWMQINAAIAGGLDINITLSVDAPYVFGSFNDGNHPTFIAGRGVNPKLFVSAPIAFPIGDVNIIHNAANPQLLPGDSLETTVAKEMFIPTVKIRVASKINGPAFFATQPQGTNAPTSDWWYDSAQTTVNGGDSILDPNTGQVKGVFMAKLAMIEGIGSKAVDSSNVPVLAPHATSPIQSADGKIQVGVGPVGPDGAPRNGANYVCVPRCFVRRDTDSPNKVRLAEAGAEFITHPRLWTVQQIYVRRLPKFGIAGSLAAVQYQTPATLAVQIGAIKNGSFVKFETVRLAGFDATIYPDWINWTSFSLAYQCSEAVDVQALLVSPGAVNILGPTLSGAIRLADYFNNTFGLLSALPTP